MYLRIVLDEILPDGWIYLLLLWLYFSFMTKMSFSSYLRLLKSAHQSDVCSQTYAQHTNTRTDVDASICSCACIHAHMHTWALANCSCTCNSTFINYNLVT